MFSKSCFIPLAVLSSMLLLNCVQNIDSLYRIHEDLALLPGAVTVANQLYAFMLPTIEPVLTTGVGVTCSMPSLELCVVASF